MIVRKSTINDLPSLISLGRSFLEESSWGWTYNEDNAARSFYNYMNHPECACLQVMDGDKLLGCSMIAYENDFQDETIGDINEFYILPEGRGTGAARELLSAVCDWFDSHNCKNVFVKSTGYIGQNKAFENLFGKYGFKVFSVVMVRGKNV